MSVVRRLLLVAVAVAVSGCGWAGRWPRPRPSTASSAASGGTIAAGSLGGPTNCRAGALQGAVGGSTGAGRPVVFVHLSLPPDGSPCVLQGVPRVELLDAAGRVLPTDQTATSLPGGSPVPLQPGAGAQGKLPTAQAYFALRWAACPAGTPGAVALRVLLPAHGGSITIPLDPSTLPGGRAACGGTLHVGPFMPG